MLFIGLPLIIIPTVFLLYMNLRAVDKNVKITNLEKSFESSITAQKKEVNKIKSDSTLSDRIPFSSAVGVIRINKINVLLPIFEDTGERSLSSGVGILEGTSYPSSESNTITVLAGHRGRRNGEEFFLHIDRLTKDDEIKITTREEVLHYRIYGKKVIEATDWNEFRTEEGKTKLFLMSCHPYPKNDKRILLKAELIKNANMNSEND